MTQTFDSPADMVAALRPEEPVYCLRPHELRATAERYVSAFPGTVMYAVKCNDDRRVLRALHEGGVRHFDTASIAEVKAINDQFSDPHCHFMHPIKSRRAIAEAYYDYGVRTFALDHEDELAKLVEVTEGGDDLTLVVRLEAPRNQAVCDLSGKFGTTVEDAADLLKAARKPGRRLGLTFHVGSQCLAPSAYLRAMELAGRARDLAGIDLDVLDVGGGFPVPYVGTEPPPFESFVAAIEEGKALIGLSARTAFFCEPGRALVAGGCSMVVKVELRRGESLYLNDGMYGSLSDMKFDGIDFPMRVIRPDGPVSDRLTGFHLFGPTCDSTDSMPGPYWLPEDIREGDWIEIGQMGAYTNVLRSRFNGFHARSFTFVKDPAFLPTREMLPNKPRRRVAA
ncbi:type III PLP-dependent enzyme [Inquilinus sp. CAU 1745]|uniref:type III PLP-dependent enzyme n=1 Tax=Inquilinus sp. CAU 1745 TaxID=3140369 RepID=UPI00325B0ECB